MKIWPVLSTLFIASLFLIILLVMQPSGALAGAAGEAPDLVVESLTLEPFPPLMNEAVLIKIRVRNQGNANASGGFRTYLYIDPVSQPPLTDTEHTQQWGHFVTLLPDGVVEFELEGYVFEQCKAEHLLYAWVDRDNTMAEGEETNNLTQLSINCQPTAVQLDALSIQKPPRFAWFALLSTFMTYCVLRIAYYVLRMT